MKNRQLAEIFEEMADAYELLEVEWKPNAYRKAAQSIEALSEPIEDVAKEGLKALKDLPGVGESIAEKILEFLKKGKVQEHQKLLKKIPKGVHKLMGIPGMGPKSVMKLYKKLKVKSLSDLEKAIKQGKVKKLEGFGEKSVEELEEGIKLRKASKKRTPLGLALPLAKDIVEQLKAVKGVERVELAGSIRRMKETVGDIDILVISQDTRVMKEFVKLKGVSKTIAKGDTKCSVRIEGLQADLRRLTSKSFGAGWMYFTGSKQHNVALRKVAIKKGHKLSEYGLFKRDKYVAGKTEEGVYKKLGFPFIPPELREGEPIKTVPDVIEYGSLKGDLQMHSKWSDGNNTILEMAQACQKMGYKYMAMTDHSKSERVANGMDEKRLEKYLKEIAAVQKKVKIRILKGAEVDILPDGGLDYADKVLKKLDIVLASIHSRFKSSKKEMTDRVCKALENPHVNILVHPTGRLIHTRKGINIDLEQVARVAKKNKVALEIDSHPERLDLNDENLQLVKGCKIAIDTDSHSVDHLGFAELGVGQARRAGIEAKDVINTWSLSKLQKFLRK